MISICAAIDRDGVIGDPSADGMLWECGVDQRHFRSLTWNADVVVGRKTWEGLPRSVRECEGRQFFVMSETMTREDLHSSAWGPFSSWADFRNAFEFYHNDDGQGVANVANHLVVAGGASIYERVISRELADRAFLTHVPIRSGGSVEWPGLPDSWSMARERAVPGSVALKTKGGSAERSTGVVVFEEWVPSDE